MNVNVIKGKILARALDTPRELQGFLMNVKVDTVEAEVIAVGADIDDIFVGDVIVAPKSRNLSTLVNDEEVSVFEYEQIFYWITKNEYHGINNN